MEVWEWALIIIGVVIVLIICLRCCLKYWCKKREEPWSPRSSNREFSVPTSRSSSYRDSYSQHQRRDNVGIYSGWNGPTPQEVGGRQSEFPVWGNYGQHTNTRQQPAYRIENERNRPSAPSGLQRGIIANPNNYWPFPPSASHQPQIRQQLGRPSETDRPLPTPASPKRKPQTSRPGARSTNRDDTATANRKRRGAHSAPAINSKKKHDDDEESIDEQIWALQSTLKKGSTLEENARLISQVQQLLLSNSKKKCNSDTCPLIIGVDATPATLAGYCVNLKEKRLCYYVIRKPDLPWTLHDPKDTSEFEMKNFMLALVVWQDQILKHKRLRIYTDNFAITKNEIFDINKYGNRAASVLTHYKNCKGVEVENEYNMAVNRLKNLKHFVKYIQPADDLSRWQINTAVEFLTTLYGIDQENVDGTHYQAFVREK